LYRVINSRIIMKIIEHGLSRIIMKKAKRFDLIHRCGSRSS
jgi:hypothetical protein